MEEVEVTMVDGTDPDATGAGEVDWGATAAADGVENVENVTVVADDDDVVVVDEEEDKGCQGAPKNEKVCISLQK